jgi:hypothetical protein
VLRNRVVNFDFEFCAFARSAFVEVGIGNRSNVRSSGCTSKRLVLGQGVLIRIDPGTLNTRKH